MKKNNEVTLPLGAIHKVRTLFSGEGSQTKAYSTCIRGRIYLFIYNNLFTNLRIKEGKTFSPFYVLNSIMLSVFEIHILATLRLPSKNKKTSLIRNLG